jgi:hypothetical protein
LASENGDSARARLIKTRRGTWIDECLLPEARRECLGVLREAARNAVGEATHLPNWISDASNSVEWDLEELSSKRLEWKPTPAEQEMEEEVAATIDALEDRGAFERLGTFERFEFEWHVKKRIRSKYESQIAREVEEARRKNPRPKSNPTLITKKDSLNAALDELHRRGVLDEITVSDFLHAPVEEEDAQDLAREARKTAEWCGCCGRKLPHEKHAYFGSRVYVGMWALYWDRVSKPQICKLRYERTVLCGSCAPEWLSLERDDVVTQLCAYCERLMVLPLKLSSLRRTFCSDPCQRAYRNQLRKEERAEERKKVCEICGKEFTATRRDAKTCSDGCKQKAYRRRKKEVQQNR